MIKIRVAIIASYMMSSICGADNLNGARGKIFNVDFSTKSFELFKATAYDPVTQEGQSRFTVYWNDETRFTTVKEQKNFNGIQGPVVTDFYYLESADTQAVREGKDFSSQFAGVYPEAKKPSGLREDGRRFVTWFSPDSTSKKGLGGTVEIDGARVSVSLVGRKPVVYINTPAAAKDLATGLFGTRIYGEEVDGRFTLSRLDLYPLEDPRIIDDPNLPRVLIVGDSISMNYHNAAKSALKGKANYYRVEGNGGPSDRGVDSMDLWLGNYTQKGFHWDVIQFNHGLHDLKQVYDPDTKVWGKHQVSLEDYKRNLEKEIQILKKTGATLIWCSTTPVPSSSEGPFGRHKDEDLVFNRAALEIVSKYPEIQILDLNSLVRESLVFDEWRKGNNVHFKGEEQVAIGEAVADLIIQCLETSP